MSKDRRTIKFWKGEVERLTDENKSLKSTDKNSSSKSNRLEIATLISSFGVLMIMFLQWCLMKEQTAIFNKQTEIIKHQDSLFQIQISQSEEQNKLIKNQNDLFKSQNDISELQKNLSESQNYLLGNQNTLIENQNEKIDLQSDLLDADRKSGLNVLFNGLIEKIDSELSMQNEDSSKSLSQNTINRVIALSHSFRPYYFLLNSNNRNEKVYLSPERGQLLLFLINSKIDKKTLNQIFKNGNFKFADLGQVIIENFEFEHIDLSNSNFKEATLNNVSFLYESLSNAIFKEAKITNSIFYHSTMHNIDFSHANIFYSSFIGCKIKKIDFSYACLEGSVFRSNPDPIPIEGFRNKEKDFWSFATSYQNIIFSDKIKVYYNEVPIIVSVFDKNNKRINYEEIPAEELDATVYKGLNFEHANLNLVRLSDLVFEESNFNHTSMAFINPNRVSFVKCKTKSIRINKFTLDILLKDNGFEENKGTYKIENKSLVELTLNETIPRKLHSIIVDFLRQKNGTYSGFDSWPRDTEFLKDEEMKVFKISFY